MTALAKSRMSVDEFLVWAGAQPQRWELFEGVPVAMSPERVIHGDTKYRMARAFDEAIRKAGLPCRFVLDSAAVRINERNSYQPDLMIYCGEPVPPDSVSIENPIIVFEVLSPGNAATDLRDKLQGYFRVASIEHYLIVDPDKRLFIHHRRGNVGAVTTRIVTEGAVMLDPPGLPIDIAAAFAAGA